MKISKFRAWMAFYIITLSFGFIFLITLAPEAQTAKSNDTILGFLLGTGLAAIVSFYFGSNDDKEKSNFNLLKGDTNETNETKIE